MYKQSKSMLISIVIQFFGLRLFTTPIAKKLGWSLWAAQIVILILTFIREKDEVNTLTVPKEMFP